MNFHSTGLVLATIFFIRCCTDMHVHYGWRCIKFISCEVEQLLCEILIFDVANKMKPNIQYSQGSFKIQKEIRRKKQNRHPYHTYTWYPYHTYTWYPYHTYTWHPYHTYTWHPYHTYTWYPYHANTWPLTFHFSFTCISIKMESLN
jgi:hypothetical protein